MIPHKTVAAALIGAITGAMVAASAFSRWPDAQVALLGDIGWLPFLVAISTLVFLAINSRIAQKNLENTGASLLQAQRAEVATRFQKGLELLESSVVATRVGGIAVLRDVAVQAPEQYWHTVTTVLVHLIQHSTRDGYNSITSAERAPDHALQNVEPPHQTETGADVSSAMEVLGLKDVRLRDAVSRANVVETVYLDRIAFTHVTLADLDLRHVRILHSAFQRCSFVSCDLSGCVIDILNVGVLFRGCNMKGVMLSAQTSFWEDSMRFLHCDLTHGHLITTGLTQHSFFECDVTDFVSVTALAAFGGCWYKTEAPDVRSPDKLTPYSLLDLDIDNVAGQDPIGVANGLAVYRTASQGFTF